MSEVGGPKQGLMNIGEEAKPPFAVLPDLSSLFLSRSKRLAALAPDHELAPYLTFLATLTRAQHDIQQDLPQASLPPLEHISRALEHGMPPLSRTVLEPDDVAHLTIDRLLDRLAGAALPPQTAGAIKAARALAPEARNRLVSAALKDPSMTEDVAQRTLIAAGLQMHFARLAAMLTADDLKPVADGVCPVCGSAPMTSCVVGWPKAHNTRFCTCSLCATMWNVVRVKCVLCSSTEGITYRMIEGKPDSVKAEVCDRCRGYVKILQQHKDPAVDIVADDVASLGLDLLMRETDFRRGGVNALLLGY